MASSFSTIEESSDSSSENSKTSTIGKKFPLRPETPFCVDDLSAGNPAFTKHLKELGHLGHFFNRDKIIPTPIRIEINPLEFHTAIYSTLCDYFNNTLLLNKGFPVDANSAIHHRAQHLSSILADGCCIIAYLKVRNIIISEFQDNYNANNLKRPRGGTDHVIPLPFAYAIQQLGIVHAIDLQYQIKYAPVYPDQEHEFGLPIERQWNPHAYNDAVSYARSLGMKFSTVNLKEKKGTAWWLLRPYCCCSEERFELQCTLPETNFTSAMALTYALFLPKEPYKNIAKVIFDISGMKTENYGTMLRSPHHGINLTVFENIYAMEQ